MVNISSDNTPFHKWPDTLEQAMKLSRETREGLIAASLPVIRDVSGDELEFLANVKREVSLHADEVIDAVVDRILPLVRNRN